ncbi:FMN-binding negative transcriptional regulator [Staphylococcus sp. Marseille-Q5304]|uniref:FMN-binding negative transcriptional regulator n=1 Tax=Staphylococcus sp. Marseille-Q5304 TaxID=2942200 RepID=UPI0020744DF8|nr:FMN-binding negative transcriptional regulator [Staphylococcus sp. Marseille-Q5304]
MYIPKQYEIHDIQEMKQFMKDHAFVTIVSVNQDGKPMATHMPVNVTETGDEIYISGHFAKGNTQWQTFEEADDVLVIFQGPHSYISSTWYEKEDVPTWNYQSIQVYGRSRLLTEQELEQELIKLLDRYEGHRDNGATWDNMSDQTRKQIKGIVGFELKVTEIAAAYKLSQSRSESDRSQIVKELENSGHNLEQGVAQAMKQQGK